MHDVLIMLMHVLNQHTAFVAHAARLVREGDEQSHEGTRSSERKELLSGGHNR